MSFFEALKGWDKNRPKKTVKKREGMKSIVSKCRELPAFEEVIKCASKTVHM